MNKQEHVKGIILEARVGSHMYGTNTPQSDEDFVGIYIPTHLEYLLSNKYIKEKDMSIVSKKADGRNDNEAVDRKFYTYRNFINLAISNTPNILELLFAKDNIIYHSMAGTRLIAERHMFLNKNLIKRFVGYSDSQSHKMQIKTDKYNEMNAVLKYLESLDGMKVMAELQYDKDFERIIAECETQEIKQDQTIKKVIRVHDKFLTIGDLNIPMNVYVKNAVKRLKTRIGSATNRTGLITKHGYDTKFACNLIRLLSEGKELIETMNLVFPLNNRELLLDIKEGRYEIEEVFQMRDELLKEINSASKTTKLPDEIDVDKINKWYENEIRNFVVNK